MSDSIRSCLFNYNLYIDVVWHFIIVPPRNFVVLENALFVLDTMQLMFSRVILTVQHANPRAGDNIRQTQQYLIVLRSDGTEQIDQIAYDDITIDCVSICYHCCWNSVSTAIIDNIFERSYALFHTTDFRSMFINLRVI